MPSEQTDVKKSWRFANAELARDDPLLSCLILLTQMQHKPFSADTLTAGLPLVDFKLTPELFVRAAARAGLSAQIVRRSLDKISNLVLPAVLLLNDQQACVLVQKDNAGRAQVIMPETGVGVSDIALDELAQNYSGFAIFTRPAYLFDARTEGCAVPKPEHWFWGVLQQTWPIYGEALVASFLINVFALVTPLFIMNVYDRVVPNNAVETLWVLAIGAIIVFGFDLLMRTLRGYFIDVAGKKVDVILSANIFERMMGVRMEVRPASVGVFANNLQEFEAFRDFLTSATITTVIDLPFIVLFVLVIWWVGGPLALIPLIAVPVVIAVGLMLQGPLRRVVQEVFRHSAQRQATLIETLSGLETVKSVGAEGPIQRKWEQVIGQIARLGLKARFLSAAVVNVSIFIQQIVTIAVVIYGVYLISEKELTVGGLIACTILTGRVLAPLSQVAGLLTRYYQSKAALDSLNNMMRLPVERPPGKSFVHRPKFRGEVEFKNVDFTYPGQTLPALSAISFKIAVGERVGIIGRIGSGKTTVEKLILGLYNPTAGSVLIDGIDQQQIDPTELRRNIGYVPQDVVLFYGSVKDNIIMGAPYVDDSAMLRAAEIAGVADFVNRHPMGFDMPVGERGDGLSGGQKQTIAIARAQLLDPPILLMDEPSNSIDNRSEELFKSRLGNNLENKTLILVTHRASLLTLVNRLIVIDGGRVVADGAKEQVLAALAEGRLNVAK